jgi:hypothetical protein
LERRGSLERVVGTGDPLEQLQEIVDVELFRPVFAAATGTADRSKGGRPPFDAVLTFKTLILQAQHGLSFEQTERLVRGRLSLQGLLALSPSGDRMNGLLAIHGCVSAG